MFLQVSPVTLTFDLRRSQVIDYAVALESDVDTLNMIYQPSNMLDYLLYAKVMTDAVWFLFPVALVVLSIGFFLVLLWYPDQQMNPIIGGVETVVKVLLQQSGDSLRRRQSSKILLLTTTVFGYLLLLHYEAVLTSTITVRLPAKGVQSLGEAYDLGIQVVVMKDSNSELRMKNAPKKSPLHRY